MLCFCKSSNNQKWLRMYFTYISILLFYFTVGFKSLWHSIVLRKMSFHQKGRETLEQVVQRCRVTSMLRGFQNPTGEHLTQPDLVSDLALLWSGSWTRVFLRFLPARMSWVYSLDAEVPDSVETTDFHH